ncbi:hypothetical protein LMG31884_47180 (plasmid) [Xanthomonas hydrangeae]|uniref:zeta toxin family protein n=1 Tax=Xanthomonas hydrangeae TaxID=2775159 RepID=UPI001965D715|nr:hypothetical protein LMG31884_47180 [Xanthomonas hydrangeae]CAD7741023.1 hypothetical protein LMG31884_47180 [Xanthomonas hydrangeae]CAD7747984.1 hypothetical protein LMG31887_46630 [Xanthomonas hydrangeae]CAD7747985.1 hypothetical protein LMG31887_46630 [Xanthomonas hydrangeae]CAD7748138.1 hypothetical protein LMG31885_44860 [Xanthomonas hydrangeae]
MPDQQPPDEQPSSSYDDDEKVLVKKIVGDQLRLATARVDDPVGIYTAGAPGSGKSRNIVDGQRARFAGKGGIAEVDPDVIREVFPSAEEEMAAGGTTFSAEAYRASAIVSYELCIELAGDGRNILRDGTLANADYTVPEIKRLKEEFSYSVEIHCAVPPPGLSWARTVARREADARDSETGFGRGVDQSYHDMAVTGLRSTTQQIFKEGLADRYVLYDGRGEVLLDRQRGADGRMTTLVGHRPEGEALANTIEHYQSNPSPRDLVDEAQTWSKAMESLAPGRSEVERAEVARYWLIAVDKIGHDESALALLKEHPALVADMRHKTHRVLVVEAWYRNETEARKAWPEGHKLMDGLNARVEQHRAENGEAHLDWRREVRHEAINRALQRAAADAESKESPER